jgi:penicillin amidase
MKRCDRFGLILLSCLVLLGCSEDEGGTGTPGSPVVPPGVETLSRAVEVYRDEWGIPHIYAQNRGDMVFMQGYEMARDRIFHMDHLRRFIYGARAEVFGEAFVEDDVTKRIIGFRRLAEANLAYLEREFPESVSLVRSFCNGVNAYIEDMKAGRNGAARPLEFDRIDPDYWPDPWEPRDVVAVAKAQIFLQSFQGELEMFIFLGRILLFNSFDDLMRFQPMRPTYILEPFPTPGFDAGASRSLARLEAGDLLDGIPEDEATRKRIAEGLLMIADRLGRAFGGPGWGMTRGSNNWVVDDGLTEGGACILCNDPHMPLDYPSTMMATHIVDLSRDEVGAIGNIVPGAPLVLIGHTAKVAWGLTNGFGDATDLYKEKLGKERRSVLFNDRWVPLDFYEETIRVRAEGGSLEDTTETAVTARWVPHHGPILIDLLPEDIRDLMEFFGLIYSARWPGFSDRSTDLLALRSVVEAETVQEAMAALEDFNSGVMNWVFADSSGSIGHVTAGPYPMRAQDLQATPPYIPLPGGGEHEWQGFLPLAEQPQTLNPDKGYVVTANNTISDQTLDNDPVNDDHYYGHFFDLGTRAWRITERIEALKAAGPIRLEHMTALQTDDYAVLAEDLLPPLLANRDRICEEPASDACRALGILEAWDMNFDKDSAGATLFSVWYTHLAYNTVRDDIPSFFLGLTGPYLSQLVGRDLSAWLQGRGPAGGKNYFDDLTTTGRVETADDQMAASLEGAVEQLAAFFGPDRPMETWRWGEAHQKKFAHPVWDDLSQGFFENDGGQHSVDPAEYPIVTPEGLVQTLPYRQGEGPAFRFCVEMKEGEWRTYNVLAGGQSGHVGDEHFADQIPLWLSNRNFPFWVLREDVEAHAESHRTYPEGFPSVPMSE